MYQKETKTVDWSKDGTIYEHTEVKLNQNNTQKNNHPSIFLNASIEGHRWAGPWTGRQSSEMITFILKATLESPINLTSLHLKYLERAAQWIRTHDLVGVSQQC